jgi:Transcription termination factor nusG
MELCFAGYPPLSDRGLTKPRSETSAIYANASKKSWFAVCAAPSREEFVQAQLIAKQIRSFLLLYATARRWKNGVRREIQHPLLPGYVFVRLGSDERLPMPVAIFDDRRDSSWV